MAKAHTRKRAHIKRLIKPPFAPSHQLEGLASKQRGSAHKSKLYSADEVPAIDAQLQRAAKPQVSLAQRPLSVHPLVATSHSKWQ